MGGSPSYPQVRPQRYCFRRNQAEVLPDELDFHNALELAKNILEAPFCSLAGTGNSASDEIEAEINFRTLRSNIDDMWDFEPGEVLDVKVFEQTEGSDIYEGTIEVVDRENRDEEWEVAEGWIMEDEYFDEGGILVIKGPEELENGRYNFYIEDRKNTSDYEGVVRKLNHIFDEAAWDDVMAKRYLQMDYDRFSKGRMF